MYLTYDTTHTKTETQNQKFFYCRISDFEGLNNSSV